MADNIIATAERLRVRDERVRAFIFELVDGTERLLDEFVIDASPGAPSLSEQAASRWGDALVASLKDWEVSNFSKWLELTEPEHMAARRKALVCRDCNGTGEYRGLIQIEVCKTCRGSGNAADG